MEIGEWYAALRPQPNPILDVLIALARATQTDASAPDDCPEQAPDSMPGAAPQGE